MYISFFCVDFFALGSKRKPNSQWNIGGVGCLVLGLCVGHVHFIFFVLISFASGTQRKPVFWWNMGLYVIGEADITEDRPLSAEFMYDENNLNKKNIYYISIVLQHKTIGQQH